MEHVLSYQRRLQQLENEFMRRGLPSLRNGVLALAGGSGRTQALAKNRLLLIDSQFRRSPLYNFYQYDRAIKTDLFFKEKKRREQGRPSAAEGDPDNYLRLFGDKQPRDIPETSA